MLPIEKSSLAGKAAFITGSTRGIGLSIANVLADFGARVVIHGHQESNHSRKAQESLIRDSIKPQLLTGDLSIKGAAERIFDSLRKLQSIPDILVLNAAVQIRKSFNEVDDEMIDYQFNANFRTNYRLIQLISPHMIERGWGRIVCVGSVQEELPHPDFSVYAALKSAQKNLVENLSRQLGPKGITVNNLSPGVFLTDRNTEALSQSAYAEVVLDKIPVGFFAESNDIAGAAYMLCTDAGRYINGATVRIDGGMSLPK